MQPVFYSEVSCEMLSAAIAVSQYALNAEERSDHHPCRAFVSFASCVQSSGWPRPTMYGS